VSDSARRETARRSLEDELARLEADRDRIARHLASLTQEEVGDGLDGAA